MDSKYRLYFEEFSYQLKWACEALAGGRFEIKKIFFFVKIWFDRMFMFMVIIHLEENIEEVGESRDNMWTMSLSVQKALDR